MRRSVLIAIVSSFLLVVPAFSATIGPVKSQVAAGDLFLGLGYSHTDAKWEDNGSFSDLEIRQNKFFGQAGYGLGNHWVTYLRAGVSTHDADNVFLSGEDFTGEKVVPFVTVGANGPFIQGEVLSIGPFVQGSYYLGENEDTNTTTAVTEKVTLDEMWEARAGLGFQIELEGAQLYGGPMYYISKADIESSSVDLATGQPGILAKTAEEEDNFGMVFGIQWRLREDVTLDLEAQLRSSFDIGLVVNRKF
jgi:hypothetical protein